MTDTTDPPLESTTSFYNLLFSDPLQTVTDNKTAINDKNTSPDYSESFYGPNPPKMLCFGGFEKEEEAICSEITAATFKQMVCQSESSSASSANNIKSSSNPNRKRNRSCQNPVNGSVDLINGVSEGVRGKSDKTAAAVAAHAKPRTRPKPARKEKIGERIATIQQLVSPFGKTDTASVLHEAFCYIKFLHDQIQILSSPYLHQLSPNQERVGLKCRGLCLVPAAYTAEVASANGADYWAPAGMEGGSHNLG